MSSRRVLALLLPALLLGACAGLGGGPREELKLAVQNFNDGIRWGKVDQSAMHLPVDRRQKFQERYASFEDELEIMDYEVQRVDYDRQAGKAQVRVDISWALKRRGVVERTLVEETWQLDRGWFVVGMKRLKGSALPVLD